MANSTTEATLLLGSDTIWLLLTGINILLMQDHSIGSLVWFFVGWGIFSGDSPGFGMGNFGNPALDEFPRLFQQFGFAATASTIVSGSVSGRLRLEAYMFLTMGICALTYPIQGHWIWASHGWLRELGFLDFAGSCVVHVFGGGCALAAAKMAGSRPGRFESQRHRPSWKQKQRPPLTNDDNDVEQQQRKVSSSSSSPAAPTILGLGKWSLVWPKAARFLPRLHTAAPMPPAGNATLMVVGALILYVSWFSFNAGSSGSVMLHSYQSARAAINTLLASGAGCTTFFLLSALKRTQPGGKIYNLELACNALLVSLAAITGPCGYVHPWAAVLTGVFAVLMAYPLGDLLVLRVGGVDDTLGAVSVHAFGGAFGTIWLGLVHPDVGAFYTGQGHFFGVQLLGVLISFTFGLFTTAVLLFPFYFTKTLAYSTEEQLLGVDFLHFGGEDGRDMDLDSDSRSGGDEASELESLAQRSTANMSSLNEPPVILTPPHHTSSAMESGSQHSDRTLSTATLEGRREAANQLKRALDDEDPRVRRRFRAYLKVLHAGESVEFWDQVNRWKRLTSDKKRVRESARIINQYCLDESPTQVNLKSSTVIKMREALANERMLARTDVFDECLDELFKDLKHTFVQFVEKTPNYWL
ncbi:hypothetical protein BASA81_009113 [Batrachochytrium salamandrivorans]|nr:hypothetical protein BASA81_009113 [Batrachochytrium salamandrivorans]